VDVGKALVNLNNIFRSSIGDIGGSCSKDGVSHS
jgi:hypothetical protein